jgi:hypothetical protein
MSGRYDNALNFANTAAQFQQARMLAAQSNVMQAQLGAQRELIALEKQKSRVNELEKQARQQLIDIEFEFKKITNISQTFPLYSYYYCEHMFGIIAKNDFFNQYLTEVNDIRLARETATQIEAHMQLIVSNNSKIMDTEYPYYSQGMVNMPIIEETLRLITTRAERRGKSSQNQKKFKINIQKNRKNGSLLLIAGLTSLAMVGYSILRIMFAEAWDFCGVVPIGIALTGFFLYKSNDNFNQLSVLKLLKMKDEQDFQHDEQSIKENTELLGFSDPSEIGEWLAQNQEFFSSRSPI